MKFLKRREGVVRPEVQKFSPKFHCLSADDYHKTHPTMSH